MHDDHVLMVKGFEVWCVRTFSFFHLCDQRVVVAAVDHDVSSQFQQV